MVIQEGADDDGYKNGLFTEKEIVSLARKISSERIAPSARERDGNGDFPWEAMRVFGACGLMGMIVSERENGTGANRATFALATSEVAKAYASTALVYVPHAIALKAIEVADSKAVRTKSLASMMNGKALGAFAIHEPNSGSNAGTIATTTRKEGDRYLVNGSKFYITPAGEADVYVVLVRTDPRKGSHGMSTLLIEKTSKGLSFGRPEDKMGLKIRSSREMFFSDCHVPTVNLLGLEGGGLPVIGQNVVGWGFFGAAGISVGIARAAVDLAVSHAKERAIAGQPIGNHQAIQMIISDLLIESEAAEALLMSCATQADASPKTAGVNSFKAKLYASEVTVPVADKAIQVLGGHGTCRDYIVERLFRDARGMMLHFKTSEWLRQDIAKAALGL